MKKEEKGITILSLVVTIIIMLILAGVTINLIVGDDGIIRSTIEARKNYEIKQYQEEIDVASVNAHVKDWKDEKTAEELLNSIQDDLVKGGNFEGAKYHQQQYQDKRTLIITTKEGYIFRVTEEDVKYLGTEEEIKDIPEVEEGDIEIAINPTTWTKGNVEVTISIKKENLKNYRIEYSKNQSDWTRYNEPFEVEENTVIYARLTNELASGINYASKAITNIDKTPPTTPQITNSSNGEWSNGNIALTLSATDVGSGIDYYQYSYDNTTWSTYNNSDKTEFTTPEFTEQKEQAVYIRCVDKVGNISGVSSTQIKIDKTVPIAGTLSMKLGSSTGTNYTNNSWTQNNVYIALASNGSDTLSGHKSTIYNISGPVNASNQTAARTLTAEGTYTITVVTTDNAGNTATRTYTVKIDKNVSTAGTLNMKLGSSTGSNYTNNTWTNNSVYISLNNGSDTVSGHKSTVYNISGPVNASSQTGARTLTAEGTYTITVVTTDNAGNTDTRSYTVKIDKTSPTAGTLQMTQKESYSMDYNLNACGQGMWWFNITNSPFQTVEISEDNGQSWRYYTDGMTVSYGGYSYLKIKGLMSNGEYVYSEINLVSGNGTVTIPSPPYTNNTWTKDNVDIALNNGTDALSGHQSTVYNISGPVNASNQTGARTLTTEGTYTITVVTTDNAGNTATKSYTVKIDKTLPTISLTASTTGWTDQNVTLTGKSQDTQTGLIAYAWTSSWEEPSSWYSITKTTAEITKTTTISANGTMYFWTKDEVGNINSASITITKIDKTVPTFTLSKSSAGYSSFALSGKFNDASSGLSKIVWHYKSPGESWQSYTSTYTTMNGTTAGTTGTVTKTKSVSVTKGGTIEAYAVAYDVAGNKIESYSKDNPLSFETATYTISYDANGGSGAPVSQSKYYGVDLTLTSKKPTRAGYTFQGWSTSSTATTTEWTAGGIYTKNGSHTLYAVWKGAVAVNMTTGKYYDTLQSAVSEANGQTVKLLIDLDVTMLSSGNATVDLDSHTISQLTTSGSTLTLQNGRIRNG